MTEKLCGKLVFRNAGNELSGELDMTLVKMVARAHVWAEMLKSGKADSVRNIADRECLTESYVTRVLRLGFLAPEIVEGILEGRHAMKFADWSRAQAPTPLIWTEQISRTADAAPAARFPH